MTATSPADGHVLEVLRYEPQDPRLGRHVLHDSRSRRFPARGDTSALRSVRHEFGIPVLDQGSLGSCTGNAAVHVLGSARFRPTVPPGFISDTDNALNQRVAVGIYADATRLDPWPGQWEPDDTGSNGLSVAKVLTTRGLVSGFRHAFDLDGVLTALVDAPVMVGTVWREGMFDPDRISGRLRVTGSPMGGHEYVLDELDVERQRVWVRNSWGEGWGRGGRAWLSWDDLWSLLADDGDCTVLVPRTEPAPVPEPPVPTGVDANLARALVKVLDNRDCPKYLAQAGHAWLNARSGLLE